MSYDVSLNGKDGVPLQVKHFEEGGTRAMGGTDRAELNITYNYSWFYYLLLDKKKGLRWLYGRSARDCVDRLQIAVDKLGCRRYMVHQRGYDPLDPGTHHLQRHEYWAPTPGNAGYALNVLLHWAKANPEAVFDGD